MSSYITSRTTRAARAVKAAPTVATHASKLEAAFFCPLVVGFVTVAVEPLPPSVAAVAAVADVGPPCPVDIALLPPAIVVIAPGVVVYVVG